MNESNWDLSWLVYNNCSTFSSIFHKWNTLSSFSMKMVTGIRISKMLQWSLQMKYGRLVNSYNGENQPRGGVLEDVENAYIIRLRIQALNYTFTKQSHPLSKTLPNSYYSTQCFRRLRVAFSFVLIQLPKILLWFVWLEGWFNKSTNRNDKHYICSSETFFHVWTVTPGRHLGLFYQRASSSLRASRTRIQYTVKALLRN